MYEAGGIIDGRIEERERESSYKEVLLLFVGSYDASSSVLITSTSTTLPESGIERKLLNDPEIADLMKSD